MEIWSKQLRGEVPDCVIFTGTNLKLRNL